ncbi:MAG: DUF4139 domain-containing protein [Planctomycetota bacterium]|nr:DUF4139 domain-containing protein [Planctomycetota bacterium]
MNLQKLLCLSSLLLLGADLNAQQDILHLESKIDRVTVYPGFALIERLVDVPAQQVGSDFVVALGPLPRSAQPNSFQTQLVGDALAVQGLEMRSRVAKVANSAKTDAMQQQLDDFQQQLIVLNANKTGIQLQTQALRNMADYENQSSTSPWGLPGGVAESLEFMRTEMTKFNAELQRNDAAISLVEQKMKDISIQMNGVRSNSNRETRELRINCFAQKAEAAQIRLTYLVSGASWQPSYDVRISPDLTGVSVNSMGQVNQRTGEDWQGVRLVLSTSMPQIGLDPPEVPSLIVSEIEEPVVEDSEAWNDDFGIGGGGGGKFGGRVGGAPSSAPSELAFAPGAEAVDYGITTQFILPGKVDVAMNGEAHRFSIRTMALEVEPERYIVPSQSDNAYLRAEVTHTGDSVLLAGTAKMFLGPDYLGESSFPLLRQNDSTVLNLGIDPNLEVVYETLEDYRDDPGSFSLSSTSSITRRYRASLRLAPSAKGAVAVVVEESLPISNSDKVEVEIGDIFPDAVASDKAMAERQEKGIYQWRFTLNPGESKAVRWGYELSFDEDLSPTVEVQ